MDLSSEENTPFQGQGGRSVKANVAWNTIGNIAYLGTQWLVTYAVVVVLGYESAGILSLAMSIATIGASVALYSMRSFQASDLLDEYTNRDYIRSRFATISVTLLFCTLFAIANQYALATIICIVLYTCFKMTEALSDVYQGILQKGMRLDIVGINLIIKGVATFAAFLVALLLTRDLNISLAVLFVVSYILVLVLDDRNARRLSPFKTERKGNVAGLLKACLPLALYGLFITAIGQAPRYFIDLKLGAELLGIYTSVALPVVLVQALAAFMFSPLATPLADFLNKGEHEEFKAMVKKVLLLILVIFLVSVVLALLVGEPVLILLFGDSISGYGYLIVPLVVSAVVTAASWFLATVLTVIRKLKTLMILSGAAMAIVVIGAVPFIELFGLNGATFITILALLIFAGGCSIQIVRSVKQVD